MYKIFFRIGTIIFLNLLAFLVFWVILGAIFWNEGQWLVVSVVLSVIPLVFILFMEIKKVNQEFNNISKKITDDWKSK